MFSSVRWARRIHNDQFYVEAITLKEQRRGKVSEKAQLIYSFSTLPFVSLYYVILL
jgi:hypothetical protein